MAGKGIKIQKKQKKSTYCLKKVSGCGYHSTQ